MELVYLWVEDYKNIKKQGFNFSPRFRCEYDEKTNELNIIDKDETGEFYPKNFFGDNINITAIVGENGSGKSSIIENIFQFLEVEPLSGRNILIYLEGEKFICITDFDSLLIKNINRKIVKIKRNNHSLSNNLFIYNRNYEHQNRYFRQYKTINVDKKSVINILVYNLAESLDYKLSTFMYFPNRITIKYKDTESLNSLFINMTYPPPKELEELFKGKDDFQQFLIALCARNGIEKELEFYNDENKMIEKIDKTKEELNATFNDFINIRIEKEFPFSEENKQLIDKYISREYFELFEFDLIDEKDVHYNNLSHGEQILFGLLLNIYFYSRNQSSIFLLDEPELSLHPQWQKQLLNEIINVFKKFTNNEFQLLLTSHSPFIISDLPKQNVILLEKDEQTGNCINVTNNVDINPFGANIHTLLSHGFFMKDGLMGEFAKDKIDTAIKYLNQKILTQDELDYSENIISIIGEPIIKRELQRKLDSKRLSKIDKIDEIEEQMKLLAHRLEMIRKNQK